MQRKNRELEKCNVIGITGMMIHMTELLKSLVTTSSEGQSRFQLKYTAVFFCCYRLLRGDLITECKLYHGEKNASTKSSNQVEKGIARTRTMAQSWS